MEIQILCITKIALWGRPMGETAGGNRPQRGFQGNVIEGRLSREGYREATERLASYL